MELSDKEIIGLYVLLKKHETDLDPVQWRMFQKLSKILWEKYSIEEVEDIERLYGKEG